MDTLRTLEILITSRTPLIAIETLEEERAEQALERVAGRLRIPLFTWTMTRGLRRSGAVDSIYETKEPLKALRSVAEMNEGIYLMKDLYRSLNDAAVVRTIQDLAHAFARDRRALVMTAPRMDLPPELAGLPSLVRLELPTQSELRKLTEEVFVNLARQHKLGPPPSAEILDKVAAALRGLTLFEAERAVTRAVLDDLTLDPRDLQVIAEMKQELLSKERVLDCVPVPESLGDVGGLAGLKAWLDKRKRAFTPEAKEFGVPAPRGILLLGVQGCGKSLAAKAVAKDWGLPLLRLEPGRLFDKFIGESEKNLDRALATAERMAPCVLMIDEIFFIDLPTADERRQIFSIHLARRHRDPAGFDLAALAAASEGLSGAEIEQAVVSALYTAFARGVEISTDLIVDELKATKPLSVTRAEDIEELREWARGRAVPAA